MPVSSRYPPVDIPDLDIWSFLFERQDKPFPDDKGMSLFPSNARALPAN